MQGRANDAKEKGGGRRSQTEETAGGAADRRGCTRAPTCRCETGGQLKRITHNASRKAQKTLWCNLPYNATDLEKAEQARLKYRTTLRSELDGRESEITNEDATKGGAAWVTKEHRKRRETKKITLEQRRQQMERLTDKRR